MKQLFINKGKVTLEDTPLPQCDENSVLVHVTHSVISIGTEVGSIEASKKDTLFQHVIKQPSKALRLIDMVKQHGIRGTLHSVIQMQKGLDELPALPIGYSCSGTVISVGKNIGDLKPGDHVACGGVGKAVHAEVVSVPRNLTVKVPEGVSLRDAASATVGSIALQGVRQADVRIGEYVAVIGLGLIGQITAQILGAAGCRVIGIDLLQDKIDVAARNGLYHAINAEHLDPVEETLMYTSDNGVDATIITAASESDEIVQQAMEMTRKKGTVVVVGAVGLGLNRQPFYRKEIDFKISCSYGPGRYDESYEEKGIDYPYAYVRWTENRNMEEYLRLVAEEKVNFSSLVSLECPVDGATEIYEQLKAPDNKHMGVVLTYHFDESMLSRPEQKIIHLVKRKDIDGKIRVGLIGAGEFSKAIHLPNLKSLSNLYNIRAIASRDGTNAKETAKRFGADYATTDYHKVLEDPDINMVIIATRHNLHAQMAMEAAQAAKAILLEKPMALNLEELDDLEKVLRDTKVPFMVGFNRRFSPFAAKAKEIIGKPLNPIMVFYRVNARHLPLDHWVHGPEGGGRIIGEACHMIDFFSFLTESSISSISVSAINPKTEAVTARDNFFATLKYENGAVCSLLYTSQGAVKLGKEYIEIYVDGKTIVIDDFKIFRPHGTRKAEVTFNQVDKGHKEELRQFVQSSRGYGEFAPISLDSARETTEATLHIHRHINVHSRQLAKASFEVESFHRVLSE
jgi:predicted dehydrogenase/threonine dehydrogenase-like Zn-dependent dehydrogenase